MSGQQPRRLITVRIFFSAITRWSFSCDELRGAVDLAGNDGVLVAAGEDARGLEPTARATAPTRRAGRASAARIAAAQRAAGVWRVVRVRPCGRKDARFRRVREGRFCLNGRCVGQIGWYTGGIAVDRRRPDAACGLDQSRRPGPLHQPRAELAGVQPPRARRGPGPDRAAAGTAQVPGHLQLEPRRVLHGPRRRPAAEGAGRHPDRLRGRPDAARGATRADAADGPRAGRRAVPRA